MESRHKSQHKSKGNVKNKIQENLKMLKGKRHDQYTSHRNMSPDPPTPGNATPQPQPRVKISEIKNKTEKLDAWRADRNRKRLQEIQAHKSPFQSVVPVGRFIDKKEKLDNAHLMKTPVREMLIHSTKPLLKSTVNKVLQSNNKQQVSNRTNLFGTAAKIQDSQYKKHLAGISSRIDSRSTKKNIASDLDVHAKEKVVKKKEVVKIVPVKFENKKALKPIKAVKVKNIVKISSPKFVDEDLLNQTFEIESPKPVVPLIFTKYSPQPSTSCETVPESTPHIFHFNATKSTTYKMHKQALEATQTMLKYCLGDWERTSKDILCKQFLTDDEDEIIDECVRQMEKLLVELMYFSKQLEMFEAKADGHLSSESIQDLWDSMAESKQKLTEGKKIMENINYRVQEANNEANVASITKKRVKRMARSQCIENGEIATPRRSTRLRKMTHADCAGCTPLHSTNTPKSNKRHTKKSVLFIDEDSFSTPRSNKTNRRQTGKYRRTPKRGTLGIVADEEETEDFINLLT